MCPTNDTSFVSENGWIRWSKMGVESGDAEDWEVAFGSISVVVDAPTSMHSFSTFSKKPRNQLERLTSCQTASVRWWDQQCITWTIQCIPRSYAFPTSRQSSNALQQVKREHILCATFHRALRICLSSSYMALRALILSEDKLLAVPLVKQITWHTEKLLRRPPTFAMPTFQKSRMN